MTVPRSSAAATLRRIRTTRPTVPSGERCDMCAEPINEAHPHVVDLDERGLKCTCRACYLLFTDQRAPLRYRAVPDRYLSFPDFAFDTEDWTDLQIPVGLVFLFWNSRQEQMAAFYPSPAGATESELPLDAWDRIVAGNPELDQLLPDVEALLIHRRDSGRGSFACHLVPIDACYQLVGTMRQTWRGFDGGQEAQSAMTAFFDEVADRSVPAASPVEPVETVETAP